MGSSEPGAGQLVAAKRRCWACGSIPLLSNHLQVPHRTHQSTPLTRWNLYLAAVFNHDESTLSGNDSRERDALMNNLRMRFPLAVLAAAVLLLFSAAPSARAQDDNDQDPPSRAGRLGYVQGSVSFQPGGQGDWLDAVPNRPLTTGDNLWADKDSRAEVQIGSTSIRLNSETSMTLLDLEDNVTQVRLSMGSLYFRVRRLRNGETFEVNTPNLAFDVNEPGV